ncbi:MAG: hypothetical protein H5U40_17655 [Polyangiaceae bacterium]|nr:hypothetical protein [Polyangiaceae bacterium]
MPQTALVQRIEVEARQYLNPGDGAVSLVTNGQRVNSILGLNGAITPKLSLTAAGGYSVGFYSVADEYESWNAQLEGRFRATERILVSLGYLRSFNPSFIGNFVESDRIYAHAEYLIERRLLLKADASVSFDSTGLALLPDGTTPLGSSSRRDDIRLRLSSFAEYRFSSWFAIMATVSYRQNVTDYQYVAFLPGSTDPLPDPRAGYKAVEAWLGVRAFY